MKLDQSLGIHNFERTDQSLAFYKKMGVVFQNRCLAVQSRFRKLFDRLPSSFCRRMLRVCESLTPNFIDQSSSSIDKDGHTRSLVKFRLIYHHRVRRSLNLCIFIRHKPGIGVEDLTFLGGHIRSHEGGEGMYDSLLQDDCSFQYPTSCDIAGPGRRTIPVGQASSEQISKSAGIASPTEPVGTEVNSLYRSHTWLSGSLQRITYRHP